MYSVITMHLLHLFCNYNAYVFCMQYLIPHKIDLLATYLYVVDVECIHVSMSHHIYIYINAHLNYDICPLCPYLYI